MTTETAKKLVVQQPALRPGTSLPMHHCPGCHYGIILRLVNEVMAEMELADKAIAITGGGCSGRWSLYLDIDAGGGSHGPSTATGTGVKRVRPDALVFVVQGDGEAGAIGIGSLVSCALRAEKITSIILNNANYGMTGGQLAPTTLMDMVTTTTPTGRSVESAGFPLHAPELLAPLPGVAYAARGSVHTLANYRKSKSYLKKAFQAQLDGLGFSVVEFISACPPNWKVTPVGAVKFIQERMLAEYALGEFKDVVGAK